MYVFYNLLLCLILATESVVIGYILKVTVQAVADYETQLRAARSGMKANRDMSR